MRSGRGAVCADSEYAAVKIATHPITRVFKVVTKSSRATLIWPFEKSNLNYRIAVGLS